jgi:hypothetical protein
VGCIAAFVFSMLHGSTAFPEIEPAPGRYVMVARLVDLGGTVLVGSPADFGKLISDETEKWGTVVKFAGAKAD